MSSADVEEESTIYRRLIRLSNQIISAENGIECDAFNSSLNNVSF